jgi:DNA-binding winged helix-turn-helix (wHTH) protein/tetratricopeptide (TPR) repeat protein
VQFVFDDQILDVDRRELRRGAKAVAVEPQVFDLLVFLLENRDRVVSKDDLIASVWGGRIVSESTLTSRINAARKAVGDSGGEQRLVRTIARKGIRFVGDVRDEASANAAEARAVETIEVRQADEILPAVRASDGNSEVLPLAIPVALRPRRSLAPRSALGAFAAMGLVGLGVLAWSHFAKSAQSEQTRANIETAAKLTRISEQINMTSREDYEAKRALQQWAVELDPHNATALARLTFALVTGVLNHWSDDVVADLHAADRSLQDAMHIAPDNMIVRGAQCHILRAMRQFESAIRICGELAKSFPGYPFVHKEIGYNRLMLGQLDEALAEFQEADRIAPDSPLRWSWNQGIGLIYLMRGQDRQAIDLLSRAALEAPNAGHPAAYLASAYALAGREQEARDALEHYVKLWPKTSVNNFGPMIGTAAFNGKMERVLQGLRLAGLPD